MIDRPSHAPSRVLFLCTGNYYRSRYAEHFFNARADALGLACHADSRGLAPSAGNFGAISVLTLARLEERGLAIPLPPREPLAVTAIDLAAANLVVAMSLREHRALVGHFFPAFVDHVRYWHVEDLHLMTAAVAFQAIEREVELLIAGLAAPLRDVAS